MDKFTVHTGIAAPLKRSAVDTDQIIPAVYLKRVTKTGFEDALFANWRQDPEFLLNQPAYENASILVAGPDFGTGSSREHAVWALRDYGFKVVLSTRFADIFRGNAGKQGLVTGVVTEADLEALWAAIEASPGTPMTVDLDRRDVVIGALRVSFDIDDYTRWRLLEGLDDIGLTLRNEDKIAAYEARRESWKPRTLPIPPLPAQ
jgi:3-isopropylmalate/(R)-2-methylmalate dehydratase small subunit